MGSDLQSDFVAESAVFPQPFEERIENADDDRINAHSLSLGPLPQFHAGIISNV
jgi:hypothetical protein